MLGKVKLANMNIELVFFRSRRSRAYYSKSVSLTLFNPGSRIMDVDLQYIARTPSRVTTVSD